MKLDRKNGVTYHPFLVNADYLSVMVGVDFISERPSSADRRRRPAARLPRSARGGRVRCSARLGGPLERHPPADDTAERIAIEVAAHVLDF